MYDSPLINLHTNDYSQELYYFPFAVKLDRCVGNFNTPNGLFNKICVPNKTEYLNISVFKLITGINRSKALAKHISWSCACKFDGRKFNSDLWWNNDSKCGFECKNCHVCNYIWNPATCGC